MSNAVIERFAILIIGIVVGVVLSDAIHDRAQLSAQIAAPTCCDTEDTPLNGRLVELEKAVAKIESLQRGGNVSYQRASSPLNDNDPHPDSPARMKK